MTTLLNYTKYFSNFDVIKYLLLISILWIFLSFTLKQEFNLNFIIRFGIIICIVYYLLQIDLQKKHTSKNNIADKIKLLTNFNTEYIDNKEVIQQQSQQKKKTTTDLINQEFETGKKQIQIDNIEKNDDIVLFYSNNLNLRKINYKAFNQSMRHFDNFLKLKNDLLEKKNSQYKQLLDLLKMERNNCLNEFASITISIETKEFNHGWEPILENTDSQIKEELSKLEKLFLDFFSEINEFLEKQYYNEPITQNSFPTFNLQDTISGDTTKTNQYSENFTLYY